MPCAYVLYTFTLNSSESRVAVTVQYDLQWDNYPNDFNILKNHISLIINLRKKRHRLEEKSCNHKIHRKNLFLTVKACPGLKYKFTA